MRLAACALSAVLLSGCSWLGAGGQSSGFGTAGGAYGAYGSDCVPTQAAGYGQSGQYGYAGTGYSAGAGCVGGAYGVGGGYGAEGFGAGYGGGAGYGAGYGQGAGFGAGGAAGYGGAYGQSAGFGAGQAAGYGAGAGYGQGAGFGTGAAGAGFGGAYGPGAVGAGLAAQGIGGAYGATSYSANGLYGQGVTTLGAGAPFGAAAYGQNVVGTQLTGGQYVNGAYVQNVAGAPIYVPQPYPAPYGVPQLRGVGAAMPFGFETFGGTEFDVSGELFSAKEAGEAGGGGGRAGAIDAIDYSDAFGQGYSVGGGVSYDISRKTTLLGSVGYSKKDGKSVSTGSFQPGVYDPVTGAFTADVGSTERALTGQFGDLEQVTLEGGVRQYVGKSVGLRPYVGASAGFAYNNAVDLTQTYVDDGSLFNEQQFIDSGWRPTAAGVVGAEMAVGPRAAVGVETGLRWRDNLKANTGGGDRLSVPVKLRGRVAF